MIVHLDADAFFASVEQAADRRLRGRPVAVGGERRGVVSSASYEARKWGVCSAMPTSRAKRLCPGLIVVPGDFEKYELFSRLIFAYAHDFTPLVEQTSIDEGYFDLGPNRRTDAHSAATSIRRAVQQCLKVSVSEGVGSNKLIAQVASKLRKPDALIEVEAGREREFLGPLPNRWLPGVGPKLSTALDAAGLREIRQIAETPAEQLMLFAGEAAPQLRRFALGEDERPVVTEQPEAKSYSKQETFAEDVTDEAFIGATLRSMTDRLMAKVRAERKAVRTVSLKLRYNDFQDCLRSESLAEPTDLETDLYAPLARLQKACWTRRVSLRCVTVRLSRIYDAPPLELGVDEESERRIARTKAAVVMDSLRGQGVPLMRGHDLWLKRVGGEPREDIARAEASKPAAPAVITVRRGQACVEDFVPLNLRSAYSFMDSLLLPEVAAAEAARRGLRMAGLCDPNLHGAVPFAQAAMKAGLRPLIGAELRIRGRRRLCFAENARGYERLCRLLSLVKPTEEDFEAQCEGIVVADAEGATPEIRHLSPSDSVNLSILRSIRTLTRLHEPHAEKPRGDWHWPSRAEIAVMPPEAVRRTREIAERCGFAFEFNRLHFPSYVPADGSTAREHLRHLAMQGFRRHYGAARREVLAQLEEELGIIAEVGYEEYFLVVRDILVECRRRGIPWITRGSAGDSLVCRCLEISDFCPVRFELYFRRFLNRERMALNKLPDIDLDFPHDRKDDVVSLILEKFGHEQAALVGGFGTFQARSAVAEILKVLGMAEGQVRRFTERFPWGRLSDIPTLIRGSQECTDLPVDEEPYSTALKLAGFLDGFPRHPKQHPCGLVLSRVPIRSLSPTFISASGLPTTHFDMDAVEAVGLVKMDILAQGGLAVMRDVCASLEIGGRMSKAGSGWSDNGRGLSWVVEEAVVRGDAESRVQNPEACSESRMDANRALPLADIRVVRDPAASEIENPSISLSFPIPGEPWDDPAIWRMIAAGDSRGVHHIESPAMISLARMCGCRNIDQLVAIVSVIRPGAANSLKKEQFARRCQGLEPVVYAHPTLEVPLRSTYGVVAYEEHILQICEAFASLPPGRADVLRRALVKEKQATIAEIKGEFLACARAVGRSEEEIAVVWALVEGFQGYAFCRAHSTAYALEAYQAAWLKLHHPADFLAGVLTHGKGFYPRLVYTLEARRLGVGLLGPDINDVHEGYSVERREGRPFIRVPVPAVQGLSTRTLDSWRKGRPFASLDDFIHRVPAEFQEIQNLIRTGAFDGFGRKRAAQFWRASALAMEAGQGGGLDLELVTLPPAERLADTTRQERLDAEWELFGYTVEEHPLARWPDIDWSGYLPSSRLGEWLDKDVTVCGLIVDERLHNQSDDRLMKFVLIADRAGMIECELFADTYERFGAVVARNPVVALHGTVSPFDNRLGWTLRVKEAFPPKKAGVLTSACPSG